LGILDGIVDGLTKEIEYQGIEQRHIHRSRGMLNAIVIFLEDNIPHPMAAVFNAPMPANAFSKLFGRQPSDITDAKRNRFNGGNFQPRLTHHPFVHPQYPLDTGPFGPQSRREGAGIELLNLPSGEHPAFPFCHRDLIQGRLLLKLLLEGFIEFALVLLHLDNIMIA